MSKRELFRRLILDWLESEREVYPRELPIPTELDELKKAISIIGVRRAGKTYLLFHLAKQLRSHYPKESVVYLSLEDDRLYPPKLGDLDLFLETYYEIFPEMRGKKIFSQERECNFT